MNPLAVLSTAPRPDETKFVRAKSYGFQCRKCHAHYFLYAPKEYTLEQLQACHDIGKSVCTLEHPNHSKRFEIPL